MTYVDGFVVPVNRDKIDDYKKLAEPAAELWKKHGALDYKECVLEDNKKQDFCATFPDSFQTKEGETVVFAFITYKSREHRDEVNKKVMESMGEDCNPEKMAEVMDCSRMAYGGFKTIVEI